MDDARMSFREKVNELTFHLNRVMKSVWRYKTVVFLRIIEVPTRICVFYQRFSKELFSVVGLIVI